MYLPHTLYEMEPYLCLGSGTLALTQLELAVGRLAGALIILAGGYILMLRYQARSKKRQRTGSKPPPARRR
ncbi:hypothetical protein [Vogesella oryzae]|uniref:hypothetical protein n=1 Tax=Vogesella oryzae TaxID=1735285 RepID=UPI0015825092|nr:hypothetical protein [Vogesella oryzae]